MKKIGLIINPIAGMGGSVGLKGTDGTAAETALKLGAKQLSRHRAQLALEVIASNVNVAGIYCLDGTMGAIAVLAAGLTPHILGSPNIPSSKQDTDKAVTLLLQENIDLLLFVGGDGTARDIETSIGLQIPVIAIPAGVKMHSAIFANSPKQAGQLAWKFLNNEIKTFKQLEVMDIDEEKYRSGQVSPKLFGYLKTPDLPVLIQGPKVPSKSNSEHISAIAQAIIEEMDPKTIYLIGPGTTTKTIMEILELEYSLIGVDIIRDKQILRLDSNEEEILSLIINQPCKIIVTVIGGQGFLFGRGNQQLSSRVVKTIGIENIIVIASPEKLASLSGKPLQVDLNDPVLEKQFPEYLKIITGYNETTVYPIAVT